MNGHEDVVQATFAKVYAKWDRVRRADDTDASYVWRMLINTNGEPLRRQRVREWLTTLVPDRQARDRADQIADRDALTQALLRLPARQRAAVVLRYAEDLGEREVARLLGTGVGTVRSHTARGLARLRADGSRAPRWCRWTRRCARGARCVGASVAA
ncbi:SigE family RNA polymerase sigma factor [Streptomyces mayteni]